MKILIIGYCPQRFMNPVAGKLQELGHQVDLISFKAFEISKQDQTHYANITNGVPPKNVLSKLINIIIGLFKYGSRMAGFLTKPKWVVKALANHRYTAQLLDYDLVNIQMMAPMNGFYPFLKKDCKLVCSYWGSDLLQTSKAELKAQKKWLTKASKVTVQSDELAKTLLEKHKGIDLQHKIVKSLYPVNQSIVKTIAEKLHTKSVKDKLHITIGYNASENQNHIEIIDQLDQLSNEYKNKIKLFFQLSYGGSESYISTINSKLDQIGIEHDINTDFITDEEIAHKRLATEIFIHLPNTDAFCAALSESLVAQNIVITGSWLPYSLYDEHKVDIHKLNTIEDLSDLLKIVIDDIDQEKLKISSNSNKVMDIINFEKAVKNWVTILEE